MDPLALLDATSAKINKIGAVFYFHPATLAKGKELGLDGFRFYVLGRGAVLGDVPTSVVVGAFGFFSDGIMEKLWTTAKERLDPAVAAAEYNEANYTIGRERLADVAGLEAFNSAAAKIVAAVHPAGLTLYSGFAALPVPEDAPAQAMHYSVLLRELRGSFHILAVVAKGLTPRVAHSIKRPNDLEMFGYTELPEITDDDRAAMDAAEVLTDELMAPAFAVLTEAEGEALVAGTNAIYDALVSEDA